MKNWQLCQQRYSSNETARPLLMDDYSRGDDVRKTHSNMYASVCKCIDRCDLMRNARGGHLSETWRQYDDRF